MKTVSHISDNSKWRYILQPVPEVVQEAMDDQGDEGCRMDFKCTPSW